MRVALRAANGRYLCAELGGDDVGVIRANRTAIGPWETWRVHRLAGDRVALESVNGRFLSAELGGGAEVHANRVRIGPWESFGWLGRTWAGQAISAVSLATIDGQHFVCAEVGSADPIVNATRIAAGPWETFAVEVLEEDVDVLAPAGAFCIPDALPGQPDGFGDRRRIWTPAFLAYDDAGQARLLEALAARRYTHLEVLLSGRPYGSEYPEIPVDPGRARAGLALAKAHGFATIAAFDDSRGTDLSYLRPVVDATRELTDWVMGIYEVNGVFGWNTPEAYAAVTSVLQQTRALYPDQRLGLHLTPQDEGARGFGGLDFWQRCTQPDIRLDAYLFQSANWDDPEAIAARLWDYTRRLGGPRFHGYPTLPGGVWAFEISTTRTYRDWNEAQGVALMDRVLGSPLDEVEGVRAVPAAGFLDGGTPR